MEAWGNERRKYDFSRPTGFSEATGHFTQLGWGRFVCGGGGGGRGDAFGWMVVCEYYPPGNVETQYTTQVQKQIKRLGKGRGGKGSNGAGTNKAAGGAGGVVAMVLFAAGVMSFEDWLW